MIPAAQSEGNQQLLDLVQRLEERVAQLESVLVRSGTSVRLQNGGSYIELTPDSMRIQSLAIRLNSEVWFRVDAGQIEMKSTGTASIQASGNLVLKGSQILQN